MDDTLIPHRVGTASIRRGNALDLPLADESVDLVVTSPPYFALRSYTDQGEHYDGQIGSEATPGEFLDALWAVTRECRRVLKPSGSMWVNLGDKYSGYSGKNWGHGRDITGERTESLVPIEGPVSAPTVYGIPNKSLMGLPWRYAIGCIDDLGLILRAEVVWSKPNGLPESVTDRVRRSHEQWFHFTKEPRYYSAVDEVREPQVRPHDPPRPMGTRNKTPRHTEAADYTGWKDHSVSCHPLGKLPGSVWSIPSEPLRVPDHIGVDHFAAFPQEWPRRLILGWSPSGICCECGEGRRPVADRQIVPDGGVWGERGKADPNGESGTERDGGFNDWRASRPVGRREVTITGYACACDTPTAPTRPAVVLDPFGGTGTVAMVARALGRYGVHVDLSGDYNRLARWRVWQSGHEYKTHAREWAQRNDSWDKNNKPKVPAKVRRQIEAEMADRAREGRRMERDHWTTVKKKVDHG